MSNNMVPIEGNKLPTSLASMFSASAIADDLSAGVTGGFGVVSIRGSKWRIKYQGEETVVTDENNEAVAGLEFVLIKASPNLSKIFYAEQYAEGNTEAPDCFSNDGIKPDSSVVNPQAPSCDGCKHNQWGSRITESGKKAKACHDTRRVAVVPAGDLKNELYGGPMLLRVPPASLGDLAMFGKAVSQKGLPYCGIITRLSFDLDAAYPKLKFKAVRALTEDEGQVIADWLTEGDAIRRITETDNEFSQAAAVVASPTVDAEFEEEPDTPAPAKKASPKKQAKKAESKPEPVASGEAIPDADLDNILEGLDL